MHVEFRRSGGLAGIDLTADVDADELPPEQAHLVADLMHPAEAAAAPAAGLPDGFSYRLTVHEGAHSQTHHWQEGGVPAAVQPLLASLRSRAAPAPPAPG